MRGLRVRSLAVPTTTYHSTSLREAKVQTVTLGGVGGVGRVRRVEKVRRVRRQQAYSKQELYLKAASFCSNCTRSRVRPYRRQPKSADG